MDSEEEVAVWAYLMMQYNLKLGLRKLGEQGARAAVLEPTQLHMMDTWAVIDLCSLTKEDKLKVLSLLLYLKEKCCGNVKGQGCINEAPQRAYIPKEDTVLPTVSTESMFIMSTVAASKKRHVRRYNVPSTFVNTDMDENVLVVLKAELAEMIVHIAPQIYRKHITVDKRRSSVLSVNLHKALYRLIRGSLLFYRKLSQELEAFGFLVNPYNPCIANKEVGGGKQIAVIWHVDDLMPLCARGFKLTKLSCYLVKI